MHAKVETDRELLGRIQRTLERQYGIRVDAAMPVNLGLLNAKWKLETNQGPLFVKCYSPLRYGKHKPKIWLDIELALSKQAELHRQDGACPGLLIPEPGAPYIQMTPEEDRFVVMRQSGGALIEPGMANAEQMYGLGVEAARMHRAWNGPDAVHADQHEETRTPLWTLSLEDMRHCWEERWAALRDTGSDNVIAALTLQKAVVDSLTDLDLAGSGLPGWTHLDLWADNLLFHGRSVAAILDFDRVRYAYPIIDLGRAILSLTLHDGEFREENAAALAEGYRTLADLPRGGLLGAVRHVWCIESFWWLHAGIDKVDRVTNRFVDEMLVTAKRWETLEDTFGRL